MIKIGVIGAGKWGKNHVRTLAGLECQLFGVSDLNSAAANLAEEFDTQYFKNYLDMLPHVDAVTVAVPTDKHYEVVRNALLARKHVLVEKPVTLESRKTNELVELAEQQGCILSVGYLYRFNPAVIKLKQLLQEAGQIQYITSRYIHSTNPPRKDSGAVANLGVHLIDILNFVLEQRPDRVYCKKMDLFGNGLEESAMIMLDYQDYYASLEVSSCHPEKKRDMWIVAEHHKIHADFMTQEITVHPIEVSYESVEREQVQKIAIEKAEPLKAELEHFIHCVTHKVEDAHDEILNIGREEYYTTKICELALLSAEICRDLDVTPREPVLRMQNGTTKQRRTSGARQYA